LVAGDLNEVIGESPSGMARLVSECGLTDAVVDKHGAMNFTTYQSGRRVLDSCLVDDDLLGAVHLCGYEAFQANILSDHRGLFIDFSTEQLFGNRTLPLAPLAIRDINSKKAHQINPYSQRKNSFLITKQWFENISLLKADMDRGERNDELAEILFTDLMEACREAGSRVKQFPSAPHSPEMV
jgi:hypothetical protein